MPKVGKRKGVDFDNLVSLDTEVTGLDLHHGAMPYIVTSSDGSDTNYWEWDVDPNTRKVQIDNTDKLEIQELVDSGKTLVLQNSKFDVTVLNLSKIIEKWPWERTADTLIAAHLLASNQPKDLTSLALTYCNVDIQPLEDAVEEAVKVAKKIVADEKLGWRIAKEGLPEMPSAKKKVWKYDMWLPRAVAQFKDYPTDHPWWNVTAEYANGDSASTIAVLKVQLQIIKQRDLWELYLARLKVLPVIFKMEMAGLTVSKKRLDELFDKFTAKSTTCANVCLNIAEGFGYGLELPAGASPNNSIRDFVFTDKGLNLAPVKVSEKTGQPSFDKYVIGEYQVTLPPKSKGLTFINSVANKRACDTAITFMRSYRKYGVEIIPDWLTLFSSVNPTGTDTIRCSSERPNEQQISKREGYNLRYCFGPAPGREWYSLDGKNLELRIPAYESGEPLLVDLFEKPKEPPYYGSVHLLNFSTVYPDLWDKELKLVGFDKVGPSCKKRYEATWYQWCKNGNFAVQYGAVEKFAEDEIGTADKAFHRQGSHALLKSRFSKLTKLNQQQIAYAEKYGWVETIPDKSVDSKHGYPLLCSRTEWGRVLPTVPLCYHVSGTACWWMMMAMIRVQELLDGLNRTKPGGYYMAMQIHDELVFDFPRKENMGNLPIIKEIQKLMEVGGDHIGIPTPVDIEYNPETWSEGVAA